MAKTTFIAGFSRLDDAFLRQATQRGRTLLWTRPKDSDGDDERSLVWNAKSRISARTLAVALKNRAAKIDEFVLAFDAAGLSRQFAKDDENACAQLIEGSVLGSICLFDEVSRLGDDMRVVFLLREDAKQPGDDDVPQAVQVAQAAFERYAETTAAKCEASQTAQISLVRGEGVAAADMAAWLFGFLDAPAGRSKASWLKIGEGGGQVRDFLAKQLEKFGEVFGRK